MPYGLPEASPENRRHFKISGTTETGVGARSVDGVTTATEDNIMTVEAEDPITGTTDTTEDPGIMVLSSSNFAESVHERG